MIELVRDLRVINVLAKIENDPWKIMDVRVLTGLVCPAARMPARPLGRRQYPGALKGCGVKRNQIFILLLFVKRLWRYKKTVTFQPMDFYNLLTSSYCDTKHNSDPEWQCIVHWSHLKGRFLMLVRREISRNKSSASISLFKNENFESKQKWGSLNL